MDKENKEHYDATASTGGSGKLFSPSKYQGVKPSLSVRFNTPWFAHATHPLTSQTRVRMVPCCQQGGVFGRLLQASNAAKTERDGDMVTSCHELLALLLCAEGVSIVHLVFFFASPNVCVLLPQAAIMAAKERAAEEKRRQRERQEEEAGRKLAEKVHQEEKDGVRCGVSCCGLLDGVVVCGVDANTWHDFKRLASVSGVGGSVWCVACSLCGATSGELMLYRRACVDQLVAQQLSLAELNNFNKWKKVRGRWASQQGGGTRAHTLAHAVSLCRTGNRGH